MTELMEVYEKETGEPSLIQDGECKGCVRYRYLKWVEDKAESYYELLNEKSEYDNLPPLKWETLDGQPIKK